MKSKGSNVGGAKILNKFSLTNVSCAPGDVVNKFSLSKKGAKK